MPLLIQKFGGTSVADHVARTVRHGNDVIVVVSAMGKETDELIRLAGDVSEVLPGREMDMLITAGERKAMALLCMALHELGVGGGSSTRPRSWSCGPTGSARRSMPGGSRWSGAPRACRPTTM